MQQTRITAAPGHQYTDPDGNIHESVMHWREVRMQTLEGWTDWKRTTVEEKLADGRSVQRKGQGWEAFPDGTKLRRVE